MRCFSNNSTRAPTIAIDFRFVVLRVLWINQKKYKNEINRFVTNFGWANAYTMNPFRFLFWDFHSARRPEKIYSKSRYEFQLVFRLILLKCESHSFWEWNKGTRITFIKLQFTLLILPKARNYDDRHLFFFSSVNSKNKFISCASFSWSWK